MSHNQWVIIVSSNAIRFDFFPQLIQRFQGDLGSILKSKTEKFIEDHARQSKGFI